jgi:hypothetical protein
MSVDINLISCSLVGANNPIPGDLDDMVVHHLITVVIEGRVPEQRLDTKGEKDWSHGAHTMAGQA